MRIKNPHNPHLSITSQQHPPFPRTHSQQSSRPPLSSYLQSVSRALAGCQLWSRLYAGQYVHVRVPRLIEQAVLGLCQNSSVSRDNFGTSSVLVLWVL